jgi:hypothetical protein
LAFVGGHVVEDVPPLLLSRYQSCHITSYLSYLRKLKKQA